MSYPKTETNVGFYDPSFYREIGRGILMQLREDPAINWIPALNIGGNENPSLIQEFKKVFFNDESRTKGAFKLGRPDVKAIGSQSTKTWNMGWVYRDVHYSEQEMYNQAQRASITQEFISDAGWEVNLSVYHGIRSDGYDRDGVGHGQKLVDGILDQATRVEELDGTDSALTAQGDYMKALNKLYLTLPQPYRGKPLVLIMDSTADTNATDPTFSSSYQYMSELDAWLQRHPNVTKVVNDVVALNKNPKTNFPNVDTAGTHSRFILAPASAEVLQWVYNFNGIVGEERTQLPEGVTIRYGAHFTVAVYRPEAVLYTEQITWA